MSAENSSLSPFFSPRGVVVVGASREPTKLGYGLARNLVQSGYSGAVHFVNPRGGELLGRPIYRQIAELPDPVDLAVLLVPPQFVPDSLRACGERRIPAAIIASGGFRETGAEGAALEAQCLEIARHYGIRLIGPNCIGLVNTHLPIDTTFLQPPPPPPGEVAFISHSGAICAAVIDWVRGQGFGFSHLISLGNQADVNETDVLGPVAEDRFTRVLTLYLEGISNGRRFTEQAARITPHKPIIALKVGRFAAGQRAAASHTGALAGQEAAFDAAFEKAGVLRANTSEEMFQWARALAWCPLPRGRRIAVLTNAGGPGVTASDALELNGLRLADLSEDTHAALAKVLPPAASLHNPVDMLASATPEQYAACLEILLADVGVDGVIVITPPPPASSAGAVVKGLIPLIQVSDKPVILTLMGEQLIQEGVAFARAAQVVEYRFPEWAASAMGALARYAEIRNRPAPVVPTLSGCDRAAAQAALAGQAGGGAWMEPEAANALLEAYGIPTVRPRLANSPEAAAALAQEMGYPLVLKLASPDISHKSDVGGVLLNLRDAAAVRAGFETVMQRARAARPEARLEGVHLQRMVPNGQEVIVGVVQDPQFGPLVMFGSGGVEVEGLKDVAFGLAPLTMAEAEQMLEKTWAGRKLKGFRNLAPADRQAVLQVLLRLAQLALDYPHVLEIEINPLRVLSTQQGAFALDARARLR
ncbi:MAG: acetate--CoA ligase family protein [Anaerolinea sp.]|nr:acetate--CoA ligase family protein [Anaerolinea sp.]